MFSELFVHLLYLLGTFLTGFDVSDWDTKDVTPVATSTAVVVAVIDGDTVDVLQGTEKLRVRYIGIDTPEPYSEGKPECGSEEATQRNRTLVYGKEVLLVPDWEDIDDYGRALRYVYVEGALVNEILVAEGHADIMSIQPNTRFAQQFKRLRDTAKNERLGLWGACDRGQAL